MDRTIISNWNARVRDEDTVYVLGDVHNNTEIEYWKYIVSKGSMLNAGVEVNNYMPVTLDELIVNNRIFKESLS